MRYKFNYGEDATGRKIVVCISHFAGQPVKGIAKCSNDDVYDAEFGKALAQLRCDAAVAKKRCNRAKAKLDFANELIMIAQETKYDAMSYYEDAQKELAELEKKLAEINK